MLCLPKAVRSAWLTSFQLQPDHKEKHIMNLSRRRWLDLALLQAAGLLLPSQAQAVQFGSNPFKLGIASGQPTHESVVIWTRLMPTNPMRNPWQDERISVQWEISTDANFTQIAHRGETVAPPELSHSVHVDVTGLQADQVYWYRFVSHGAVSAIGKTRTFAKPGAPARPLKLAFASCQRYHSGTFVAYEHMAADEPDAVVFLGDYIYEMGATQSEVRGTWLYPANRIQDYRHLYELARSDTSLQKMHAACPWIITWDDHEVLNDYAGGDIRLRGDSGRVANRMEMGYRTWYEHMPVSPKALTGGVAGLLSNKNELRIYGTYRWGNLLDLHLLDTRQYRSKQVSCGTAGLMNPASCSDLDNPTRSVLGDTQENWLLQQLTQPSGGADSARWTLICQPSVFSRFPIPVMGNSVNHDNWDGYPKSRQNILDALAQGKARNPVFFSGDVHQNWVSHVHRDATDAKTPLIAPEFCGTSVTTDSFGSFTGADMKTLAPHSVYADRHKRGYMLANLSSDSLRVELRVVENIRNPQSPVATEASFQVNAGSPKIL